MNGQPLVLDAGSRNDRRDLEKGGEYEQLVLLMNRTDWLLRSREDSRLAKLIVATVCCGWYFGY